MNFSGEFWNRIPVLTAIMAGWLLLVPSLRAGEEPVILGFETTQQWKQWKTVTFPNRKQTRYEYRPDKNVVCGYADGSASGKARSFPGNLDTYSIIEWEWKIDRVLERGNARTKEGDDYAARVYVNFERDESIGWWESLKASTFETLYGGEIPGSSVNFIWANRLEVNQVVPSAFTDRARIVALQSGNDRAGQWVRERVDIADIYRKAFGRGPPPVQSVAIMTDADNTKSTAEGCYRKIRLLPGSED